jgi:hypothetical protein
MGLTVNMNAQPLTVTITCDNPDCQTEPVNLPVPQDHAISSYARSAYPPGRGWFRLDRSNNLRACSEPCVRALQWPTSESIF